MLSSKAQREGGVGRRPQLVSSLGPYNLRPIVVCGCNVQLLDDHLFWSRSPSASADDCGGDSILFYLAKRRTAYGVLYCTFQSCHQLCRSHQAQWNRETATLEHFIPSCFAAAAALVVCVCGLCCSSHLILLTLSFVAVRFHQSMTTAKPKVVYFSSSSTSSCKGKEDTKDFDRTFASRGTNSSFILSLFF